MTKAKPKKKSRKVNLAAFDPARKAPVVKWSRTFVRLPLPVKVAISRKAASRRKPKMSLNAYITHLCIKDLQS